MAGFLPSGNTLAGPELAAFAAAVEAGSVHGAADALALTQSAVTKRIQALERRLNGRLLERGRFGVRPTELGQVVYPAAKRALDSLEAVVQTVELSRSHGAADLRVSASHTVGEFLLPGWLAEFRQQRPEIRAQLEIVNSTGVLDAVRENRSEIGFIEGLDPLQGLDAVTVARDEIVVVVVPTHPWARRRSIPPRDLRGEAYLTREAASGTRAVAAEALATQGVELTPSFEVASFQSLKRALGGGGFTLISRLTIDAEQRAGALVGIPVSGVDLHRELRVVRLQRPALTGGPLSFWRWLIARSL